MSNNQGWRTNYGYWSCRRSANKAWSLIDQHFEIAECQSQQNWKKIEAYWDWAAKWCGHDKERRSGEDRNA